MTKPDSTCDDTPCDSAELIVKACEGNPYAFRRLVECNQDRLFASLNRFLGCHADAEEAVQEAFIRAFTRIDSFNHNSLFSTWLYRIGFNAAVSQRRKRRSTTSIDQQIEHGREPIDVNADDASEHLLRQERIALIHAALDELSDDHRAILVLREMDEMAYEEISNVLNISVGTVRSRLSRARVCLREAVEAIQGTLAEDRG
jgi:RNA polymerase sigma-70 factor (ECF subfamily)